MERTNPWFLLEYMPMQVTLISRGRAKLPAFLGSTLRGVIGQTLHQEKDAYQYLYQNRARSGYAQDVPNPYLIIPPKTGKEMYEAGERLRFEVLLLGDAAQYTQQLVRAIYGIEKLGLGACRYPFAVEEIIHSTDQRFLWKDGCFYGSAVKSVALPCLCLPDVRQASIRTVTPLRIRRNGELLKTFDFPTLIRNITLRMEHITQRYGGFVDREETERLRALAPEIVKISEKMELTGMDRYSNRLGNKMDFSGLTGELIFEGGLTPYVPWLYAAQTLHLGRNTTFGMGGIRVVFR